MSPVTSMPGFRWSPGMAYTVAGRLRRVVMLGSGEEHGEPALDDPATGGALLYLLGHEAARIRYSPSHRKQSAGTPWIADLYQVGGTDSRITAHASLGRACFAVAVALGRWS
jgi:hypothetical protein